MLKICKYCNKEFETKDKRQQYCNRDCSNKNRKSNKVPVTCTQCGKVVMKYPSHVSSNPFCSKECNANYKAINNNIKTNCDICGKDIFRKKSHYDRPGNNYCSYECSNKGFSVFYSGKNNPNFLNTYTNCSYCNKEIYRKKSEFDRSINFFCSLECQGSWQSENIVGANHPNYDNTISELDRERGRNHEGYWQFRKAVYERDNYTCQICGYNKGGILNAHHLNSYNWDIENRTNIDNAITMCNTCHKDFHSIYGTKRNTKKQFKEYIKDKAL